MTLAHARSAPHAPPQALPARGSTEALLRNARPPEIEEALNSVVIHPVSRALARLLEPTGVTPNMVSAGGVVMMALASGCYLMLPWPWAALAGLPFHFLWHVFDGADGELARRTGRSSAAGEVVDGICDHLSHVILYLAVGAIMGRQFGAWGWAITAVAGISRAFHAVAYETLRRNYRRWVHDLSWMKQNFKAAQKHPASETSAFTRLAGGLARIYLGASGLVAADDARLDETMARLTATDGPNAEAARALYQRRLQPRVKQASILSTDYETLAIVVSLLLGSALWFCLFHIVVLNAALAWIVRAEGRDYRELVDQLETLDRS